MTRSGLRSLRHAALALAAVVLAWAAPAHALLTTTLTLDDLSLTNSQATYGLFLTFPGNPGDTVEGLQLNVTGSSVAASRFSFNPTVANWTQLDPLSDDGIGLFGPIDPLSDAILPDPSPVRIGDLVIDLAGIPSNTVVTVALTADPTDPFSTDLFGTVDGNFVFSFLEGDNALNDSSDNALDDAGEIFFGNTGTLGTGVTQFTTLPPGQTIIPEPATALLGLTGLSALTLAALRRRQA